MASPGIKQETPPEPSKTSSAPPAASSTTATPHVPGNGKSHRYLALGFAVVASLAGLAVLQRPSASAEFPAAYAICSKQGKIYTVDEGSSQVECIAVRAGEILATGNLDAVESIWRNAQSAAAGTPLAELKVYNIPEGHIIVPGLADAHAHVLGWGYKMQLPLDGARSVEEIISRVKKYINDRPDVLNDTSRWIEGMGWDQTRWPGQNFPTWEDLESDPVLRGRPIVLKRIDVHATWLSKRAIDLTKASLGGKLPKVIEGGDIVRDKNGEATGIFIDNAMDLVPAPPWTESQMTDYFERTMRDALQSGLTSIHDAMTDPTAIKFFMKKAQDGKLPLRLYLMGNVASTEYWGDQIPREEEYGPDHRLTIRAVKLFTDGALGSWGAALLEPYSDRPDFSGIMRTSPETLEKVATRLWNDGFQVNIHCIGDKANNVVLDIFEKLIASDPERDVRPRIEHAQILTQADLQRMGELGVIASVQPTHATSDMGYAEARLGPDRIKGAYAYKTLLNVSRSNVLPLGSDFPVEGINPLLGFYSAVARLDTSSNSPHGAGGWFPEQKLTRQEALKGMTYDAAYASFAEHRVGSLQPGKRADYVVLNQDIMSIPDDEILDTKVIATVIDGQIAHGKIGK